MLICTIRYPNFVPLWTPGQLIDEAHKRNLEVHIWTLRNEYEDRNLPTYFNGDKLSGKHRTNIITNNNFLRRRSASTKFINFILTSILSFT